MAPQRHIRLDRIIFLHSGSVDVKWTVNFVKDVLRTKHNAHRLTCGHPSADAKWLRKSFYRLEYWGRFRALWRPYFFRSTARGSRVTKPAFLSGGRKSSLTCISARGIPWRGGATRPQSPPPLTMTSKSTKPPALVTSKGWSTIIRSVSRPKYSPNDRSLIDIAPLPFRKKTRATEVFLLPVAVVTFSAIDLVLLCFNHQRFWLLCFVWMLRTRIDLEFVDQLSTQTVFW